MKLEHKFAIRIHFGGICMKDGRKDNRLRISIILKSVMIGYIFSLICFIILALLVTFTSLSDSIAPSITQVVIIMGLAITGANAAMKSKAKGWLYGIITGVVYIVILLLISWVAIDGFTFDKYALAKVGLGVVVGAIGGMIGINMTR
jgi:putative membrane protein (TIGR04086 family)